jgi:hypothetical protein
MAGAFSIDLYVDNGHGTIRSTQNITAYAIDGSTGACLQTVSSNGTGTVSLSPGGSGTVLFQFSIGSTPILTTGKFVTTEVPTSKFGLVMTGVTS